MAGNQPQCVYCRQINFSLSISLSLSLFGATVCGLQENYFVIYDLRFDCRYLVRVQSVTNQGVLGATTHLTISTPSCHDVTVTGGVTPDCPRTGQLQNYTVGQKTGPTDSWPQFCRI